MRTAILALAVPGTAGAFEGAGPDNGWEFSAAVLWESRYLLEGRDILDGDSLLSTELEAGRGDWAARLWWGESPESNFRELRVEAGRAWEVGRLRVEACATYLWFPEESASHQEVGVQLDYELWSRLSARWQVTYSFESGGAYQILELASAGWEIGPLEVATMIGSGFNAGFVADGHRGLDHAFAAVEAQWALDDTWTALAQTRYTSAVDVSRRKPDDAALFTGISLGLGVVAVF